MCTKFFTLGACDEWDQRGDNIQLDSWNISLVIGDVPNGVQWL